jgi:OsmC-like protein
MTDSLDRALVSVRITAESGGSVSLYARKEKAVIGRGWSFDIAEPRFSGAEVFLGALASDVVGLFARIAAGHRLGIDEIEAKLSAELAAPLALLGVVGSIGEPHYQAIHLRAYVGGSADPVRLEEAWQEALRRAPLYNTLRRATAVEARMQITS